MLAAYKLFEDIGESMRTSNVKLPDRVINKEPDMAKSVVKTKSDMTYRNERYILDQVHKEPNTDYAQQIESLRKGVSSPATAYQDSNRNTVVEGGYQIIEVYSACRCVYYQHPVDRGPFYGRPGAHITKRIILVGYNCSNHSRGS